MNAKSPLNPKLMCFTCITTLYPDESMEHLDISQVKWMQRKLTNQPISSGEENV